MHTQEKYAYAYAKTNTHRHMSKKIRIRIRILQKNTHNKCIGFVREVMMQIPTIRQEIYK